MAQRKRFYIFNYSINNRHFGIKLDKLNAFETELLKEFANYIITNDVRSLVLIQIGGFDKHGIINRINIRIVNDCFDIAFLNIYCGGVIGSDRIFEVLYKFEDELARLSNLQFNHYSNYSLSNNYKLFENLFLNENIGNYLYQWENNRS